jgi:hypothetical protein
MWYAGLWRIVLGAIDSLYGGIILSGAHANSAYQQILERVCPLQIFAVVLVIVGSLIISRTLKWGGVMGAAVWMSFGMASLVTVFQHTAESDTGPVLLIGFAILHLLITYGAAAGLAAKKKE